MTRQERQRQKIPCTLFLPPSPAEPHWPCSTSSETALGAADPWRRQGSGGGELVRNTNETQSLHVLGGEPCLHTSTHAVVRLKKTEEVKEQGVSFQPQSP